MALFDEILFDTGAYFGDTSHLSASEHGAYLMILFTIWRAPDCSITFDEDYLARISRLGRHWKRHRNTILSFFDIVSGDIENGERRLVQKKLLKVRERAVQTSRKKPVKDALQAWDTLAGETDIRTVIRTGTGPYNFTLPPLLEYRKYMILLQMPLDEGSLNEAEPPNTIHNTTTEHRLNNTNTGGDGISENGEGGNGFTRSLLRSETYDEARKVAPGWDVYHLERIWLDWIGSHGVTPDNPDSAFIGFCRKHAEKNRL